LVLAAEMGNRQGGRKNLVLIRLGSPGHTLLPAEILYRQGRRERMGPS
jgi:hypothetical protein